MVTIKGFKFYSLGVTKSLFNHNMDLFAHIEEALVFKVDGNDHLIYNALESGGYSKEQIDKVFDARYNDLEAFVCDIYILSDTLAIVGVDTDTLAIVGVGIDANVTPFTMFSIDIRLDVDRLLKRVGFYGGNA